MPVWGQHRYGQARYGWDALPAGFELLRRLWSANHPWYGRLGLANYWRAATFAIHTVDPDTLANVTLLPHVAGGQRESAWEDVAFQTEKLTLSFMDPDEYLPGGTYASLVALGTLLRLEWTVRAEAGARTFGTGLYRVVKAPSVSLDEKGAAEPTAEAEGWLAKPLRELMLQGGNPLGDAVTLKNAMVALGCPIVWGVDTYATLAAALIFAASGHRLRVPEPWRTANWWGTSSPVPTEPAPPPPDPTTAPPLTADVGVGPNTTNRGTLTHFDISWTYSGDDATGGDAIFIGPDGLTLAQASEAAASLPPGDPRLVPTGGFTSLGAGIDIALDFGLGVAARFWYWHRQHGALDTAALVALL